MPVIEVYCHYLHGDVIIVVMVCAAKYTVFRKKTHLCFLRYFLLKFLDCCENFGVCLEDIDEIIYIKVNIFCKR